MLTLSATCLAISLADERGTLKMAEMSSRLGGTYIALSDEHGIIEVADGWDEANERVAALRARRAA